MEEKYQAEIQCCRRKSNESLRELVQDIRRRAYPGVRSDRCERLADFICALDDPELELKVSCLDKSCSHPIQGQTPSACSTASEQKGIKRLSETSEERRKQTSLFYHSEQ